MTSQSNTRTRSIEDSFVDAVKNAGNYPDATWHVLKTFGVSNSVLPLPINRRVYFGGPNVESLPNSNKTGVVIYGVARFITGVDVYLAFVIQRDFPLVKERLTKMIKLRNEEGNNVYAERNNNGRFVLSLDEKKFYFFNKANWDELDFNADHTKPAFRVDKIYYALYPPGKISYQSLAAGEFIHFIKKTLDDTPFVEISPWNDLDVEITHEMQRMPSSISPAEIKASIDRQGFYYADNIINRLHSALNYLQHKHFVILKGLSGTGKTSLAVAYAHAVHGIDEHYANDPLFFMVPVRPEWTDPTGLTGYFDVISQKYIVPPFLEGIFTALAHPNSPVFICLDEMNLARVEYYFSDILSSIESRIPITLHSGHDTVEGSTGIPVPSKIEIPDNIYFIGTINVDETANPLSDKVLDRAVVIDTTKVDLDSKFDLLIRIEPELARSIDYCKDVLNRSHRILAEENLQFGYRVLEEIIKYHYFAVSQTQEDPKDALDNQLEQKVLVKLKGDFRQREMLEKLSRLFSEKGLSNSTNVVKEMIKELDALGSFQYAR